MGASPPRRRDRRLSIHAWIASCPARGSSPTTCTFVVPVVRSRARASINLGRALPWRSSRRRAFDAADRRCRVPAPGHVESVWLVLRGKEKDDAVRLIHGLRAGGGALATGRRAPTRSLARAAQRDRREEPGARRR